MTDNQSIEKEGMIKKWKHKFLNTTKTIELYSYKINVFFDTHGYQSKDSYSISEFLEYKYNRNELKVDYGIYKEIAKLPKPDNLSIFAEKNYKFWKFYDNATVKRRIISTNDTIVYVKNKYGFFDSYVYRPNDRHNIQTANLFFLEGPKFITISILKRKNLKKEIIDILNKNGGNYSLNDGFSIFDYDKIPEISYEKKYEKSGVFFKIENGQVIVGGWEYPRDGGSQTFTVEYLWNNPENCVPKEFHDQIPHILELLDQAIVHGA